MCTVRRGGSGDKGMRQNKRFKNNMYEQIAEPIEVLCAFRQQKMEPVVFKWANRHYHIKRVHLVHSEREGREKRMFFSVSDGANAYRLSFSTNTLDWRLEDMASI